MLCVLMLWGLLAQPPNMLPVATVGFVDQAPLIDGDMSDPCWRDAAVLAPFVSLGTARLPSQRTVARLCADANNVYVGFWCWEDAMDRLRLQAATNDTGQAWADDCVEVFLAPDGKADVYYHVIVTANGAIDDEWVWAGGQRGDMGWSFRGSAAQRRSSQGWTCEIAMPCAALGVSSIEGTWRASVARAEQPHSEWSSWPALVAGFHEPDRFGLLVWSPKPAVTQLRIDPVLIGENSLSVTAAEGLEPRLVILRDGRRHVKGLVRQGDTWRFWVYEGGEGYLRLELLWVSATKDQASSVAFATPPVHFSVPVVSAHLDVAEERLARAQAELYGLEGPGLRPAALELKQLRAEHAALRQELALSRLQRAEGPDAWLDLQARVKAHGQRAFFALVRARTVVRAGGALPPPFGLGWQNSLIKLHPDDERVNLWGPLAFSAARDEWESAQLVLMPLGDAVRIESVTLGPLRNRESGAILPTDTARIWRVGYVQTRPPVYPVEYVGEWPDPLLPLEPFDLVPGRLQPLWISLYVPPDALPGLYCGEITVIDDGGRQASWPVQLNVWDLTLPRPSRLQTAFSILQRHDAALWYGYEGLPPQKFRRKFHMLMLEHRLNPMSLYTSEMWPPREDLEWCIEKGLNAFNLRTVNSDEPEVLDYVREQAAWLGERGWLPLAFVYGFDEVQPQAYEDLKRAFAAVKTAVPGLRRVCTVTPNPQLEGSVDIWVPLTAAYDHRAAEARRAAGDEVWWYICCGPWHPYCNWFIDYPATDARVLFWQTFKYNVTGFLYYEVAMWRTNLITKPSADGTQIPPEDEEVRRAIAAGKRWPDVPWNTFTFSRYNGDGLLVYPGKNETPLPSLRLEVIRDGIEDYDLLCSLRDARAALMESPAAAKNRALISLAGQLLSVRPTVVRDLTHYTLDPIVIAREREAVASALLRVQRALAAQEASKSREGKKGK